MTNTQPDHRRNPALSDASLNSQGITGMSQTLVHLLLRLEKVLDEERECLRTATFEMLDRIVMRKDQLAVELLRLMTSNAGLSLDPQVRPSLNRTATVLNANAALLKRHIEALEEIAGLISDIVSGASSDGTYSSNVARRSTRS